MSRKVVIEVNNSYSQIKGLTASQFKGLREELSYLENPEAAYYSGGFVRRKFLLDKKGFFPTGLRKRVYNWLVKSHVEFDAIRAAFPPPHRTFGRPYHLEYKPYEAQIKAAAAASDRGIISMPTGTGKSTVITLLIARYNVRTLVVVPTLELKRQLSDSLNRAFKGLSGITVENIDSPALKTAKDYDMLIIDEAHHSAAKTYHTLNKTAWTGIYYRFFLTATPFRNRSNEQLLFEAISGQVIYQLSYKEAISKGYIVPIKAYYIDLPKVPVKGTTWAQVYSECVVNNGYRNALISDVLKAFSENGFRPLCLVKEVQHGNNLTALCGAAFTCGQDEDSRQHIEWFNSGKLSTLVATTGIMGEGVDSKPCDTVVIAGLGKAKSHFMQQVGRAVRTHPGKKYATVVLFRDTSHKFTAKHYNEQCKILLEEYGVTPEKLEVL